MRGKRHHFAPRLSRNRITPAGAGKTAAGLSDCRAGWDHPRRCGENPVLHDFRAVSAGSPPQVRGKHSTDELTPQQIRITPAGAGKTLLLLLKLSACRDHPRRCGENPVLHDFRAVSAGSPPQVRGKHSTDELTPQQIRITPAGAGKTLLLLLKLSACRDHPRRCGENPEYGAAPRVVPGSPPQVRGKRHSPRPRKSQDRITPAGAGKTCCCICACGCCWDHPRRCGENSSSG